MSNQNHFLNDFLNGQAIKVRFKKPIFEEDFVERGMVAWFVDFEFGKDAMVNLFFNFKDFEDHNEKYMKKSFYLFREQGNYKSLGTAREAGRYDPCYSVYFCIDRKEDLILSLEETLFKQLEDQYLEFLSVDVTP